MAAKKDETATVDAPKKATAGKTAAKKEAPAARPGVLKVHPASRPGRPSRAKTREGRGVGAVRVEG